MRLKISRELLSEAAVLARQCASEATRERVLASRAVMLAFKKHLQNETRIQTEEGRAGELKYIELLDTSDFKANNWVIDVRTISSNQEASLYVPTMPLMVGVFADYYICAQVDLMLTEAQLLGYAIRADLADAELSANGLLALLPVEDLRPIENLPEVIQESPTAINEKLQAYNEWRDRAERIVTNVRALVAEDKAFSQDEIALLAGKWRDDVLSIYGGHDGKTELEPLFDSLFGRFGIVSPVPAPPDAPISFINRSENRTAVADARTKERFFRDELSVNQRVALYRHLLEDGEALSHHRRLKRVLDRATGGEHQTSPERRERNRVVRERRAESVWTDAPLRSSRAEVSSDGSSQTDNVSAQQHTVDLPFAPEIDFSSNPETVRVVTEGIRLTYGHLFNPAFATETSLIDPLPHQRIAVYEHMLKQSRLRYLLADDAGAGKTIMTGLYIREMLARRLIQRVLIVPPAGLAGNWEREMRSLFGLEFRVVAGDEARQGNPFTGADSNLLIVKIDTLAGERMFKRLQESQVTPYDLVIFDEAHKLSADREPDFRVRKTDRYKLAEAISGIAEEERWQLAWSVRHLLLLTATPHMGKDFPYYSLWRLLEPEALATPDAFNEYPPEARQRHFIRRTKEEMVRFDGSRIYPERWSNTFSYDLTQGAISEQTLYDETTDYIRTYYNHARIFNRSAARLAMSVFQRRLASSTYALMLSFGRRFERLSRLIEAITSGEMSTAQLESRQNRIEKTPDVFETMTADEETAEGEREENETIEERVAGAVVSFTLGELEAERRQVGRLYELARQVYEDKEHEESKFERLREVLRDPKYKDEKVLIFTEHRDTLDFLVRRLEGLGYAGQVAQIHGAMDYRARDEQVEIFRRANVDGGAHYLVGTDAAGEGINLQFCWLMVNYDIPWNPARLEQRMGRIHRYGQKHDPVIILNLVAGKTREGRVLHTLLEKLERIRKELNSDKVFDVIGRVFEDVSIKQYIEQAVTEPGANEAERSIEGKLTKEQVEALVKRDEILFGSGGDVKSQLPELRAAVEREELRRLLPGYVRRFIEKAAPLVNVGIEGDLDGFFALRGLKPTALEPLQSALEVYSPAQQERMTVHKPQNSHDALFLHPGEPFFERLRAYVCALFEPDALKGAVFIDPMAMTTYTFHLAVVSVVRRGDSAYRTLANEAIIDYRLVGFKATNDGLIEECSVEHLLLLKGAREEERASAIVESFRDNASVVRERVAKYAVGTFAQNIADERRASLLADLAEREDFIRRGYAHQETELLTRRSRLRERAMGGDSNAKGELTKVKEQQRRLATRREEAIAVLRREPELIEAGEIEFLAHALVIPTEEPEERKRHDAEVEKIAVSVTRAYEESSGATVRDVSTAARAVACGLTEHPGFDILSKHASGEERLIEVKGRAEIGTVELTENEWIKACNLRDRYWLYVVYDCATPKPHLIRVQDPFSKLVVKTKSSVVIDRREILAAADVDF